MKHIVITIGREYGSGGRLIAQRLAEELGVTFYDKQLIAEVAKRTGFSEHFVRDAEHQRPTNSFLYDLYCAVQTPSVPDQMFIAQAKVIKEAAARESCVIVGRCADYILREEPYCLKTFVYAPLEQRVRRAREAYNVEQPNLESYVLRQDKARASYYNYFATGRWGDSRVYDVFINSRIGIEAGVEVVKYASCGMSGVLRRVLPCRRRRCGRRWKGCGPTICRPNPYPGPGGGWPRPAPSWAAAWLCGRSRPGRRLYVPGTAVLQLPSGGPSTHPGTHPGRPGRRASGILSGRRHGEPGAESFLASERLRSIAEKAMLRSLFMGCSAGKFTSG